MFRLLLWSPNKEGPGNDSQSPPDCKVNWQKQKTRDCVFPPFFFFFFFLMFALASSFSKLMLLSNFLTAIKKTGITALS